MRGKGTIFITTIAILLLGTFAEVNVTFDPPCIEELFVGSELNVTLSLQGSENLFVEDDNIAIVAEPETVLNAYFLPYSWNCENFICNRTFKVVGRFLGFGKVFTLQRNSSTKTRTFKVGGRFLGFGKGFNLQRNSSTKTLFLYRFDNASRWDTLLPPLEVTVLRQDTILNTLFKIFVATVVTINYINFGCALDLDVVKEVLKRPIGPAIGFVCQFVIMPLVSYGVGLLLFTDPVLRLGLFTFGSSPGGGASNMWTVLLGGNVNLSITMTFISTVAAFGTLPLWLFTLGKTILKDTDIVIPYLNIITSLVCLVIPIAVGLLIQRFFPKVAARSKKILAPVCIFLLIGIIVMASVAHTYIFYMLSWSMVIAASLSVWTGFIAGILVSMAFGFSYSDVVAVSVETGIQNSGIAFILLIYSLPHPVSDMAAVVPVAGSIITPIPLFAVYCYMKFRNFCLRSDKMELQAINSKQDEYSSTKSIINSTSGQESELKNIT